MKVIHLLGLQELYQLDVKRSEKKSINAWNFFSLKGGQIPMRHQGSLNVQTSSETMGA